MHSVQAKPWPGAETNERVVQSFWKDNITVDRIGSTTNAIASHDQCRELNRNKFIRIVRITLLDAQMLWVESSKQPRIFWKLWTIVKNSFSMLYTKYGWQLLWSAATMIVAFKLCTSFGTFAVLTFIDPTQSTCNIPFAFGLPLVCIDEQCSASTLKQTKICSFEVWCAECPEILQIMWKNEIQFVRETIQCSVKVFWKLRSSSLAAHCRCSHPCRHIWPGCCALLSEKLAVMFGARSYDTLELCAVLHLHDKVRWNMR